MSSVRPVTNDGGTDFAFVDQLQVLGQAVFDGWRSSSSPNATVAAKMIAINNRDCTRRSGQSKSASWDLHTSEGGLKPQSLVSSMNPMAPFELARRGVSPSNLERPID